VLTVLFATRNRATLLRDVLTAFTRLEPPPGGWALVIADNGSTDASEATIRAFAERLPLTLVTEPAGGKNAALNAGLAHCAGDLIVFTDDDVFPHVIGSSGCALERTPTPHRHFRGPRLAAMGDATAGMDRARHSTGADVHGLRCHPRPWSNRRQPGLRPNMAVRAEIFATGARFDPSIGRQALRAMRWEVKPSSCCA